MDLKRYFADVGTEMNRKSAAIRQDFATHNPTAGSNREELVGSLLRETLPHAFGVGTGLISSADGQFSNQADLVVVDAQWSAPFHPSLPNPIWLVEAVYCLLEVKTSLSPRELADSVTKCRRFKQLPRNFSDSPLGQQFSSSLFCIYGFEAPSDETFEKNFRTAIAEVPEAERPDFVIVPERFIVAAGEYRELSKLGEPQSSYRQELKAKYGSDLEGLVYDSVELFSIGDEALLAWQVWLQSWLKRAGPRSPELIAYLPLP